LPSASRRFFRRVKSCCLQTDFAYRLNLKFRFGAGRLSAIPDVPLPNKVLQNAAEWKAAFEQAQHLRVPHHRSDEKDWDHLAAAFAILGHTSTEARILDAGAEFYSNVLPTLFVYGYRNLFGINLSFADPARRGPIRYLPGDMTKTGFPDGYFDAATCMSVIEHGVPLENYFREMYRVLKPGGLLITSTDYYPTPVDTRGQLAYGAPIKIFTRDEMRDVLKLAAEAGFEPTGEIDLECKEKAVRWAKFNLEYTFVIFTLRKKLD
jgi:SAM-dependent methyltransferase